jgi:hypothetical protein
VLAYLQQILVGIVHSFLVEHRCWWLAVLSPGNLLLDQLGAFIQLLPGIHERCPGDCERHGEEEDPNDHGGGRDTLANGRDGVHITVANS